MRGEVSVICEAAAGEMLEPAGCEVANGGRSRGAWLNIAVRVVISHERSSAWAGREGDEM